MEFSNLYSIYLFLPVTIAVYFLLPSIKQKNTVLVVASLLFYALGQPYYLPVLLLTALVNYILGYYVQKGNRLSVWLPMGLNLAALCLFKLLDANYGADSTIALLPMGISFYTFQMISYHVDIYRGKITPAESFTKLLLYISMFPKLLMGPIVRYEQIGPQIDKRRSTPRGAFEGMIRFVVGLAKKVLIADYAYAAYTEFAKLQNGGAAWLGALMFMFYIYFEFSGCADMAIGLGRIFGFRYAENFDLPYASRSITDFWRRWHATLGSFFRDYVYIPLGGNRKGKLRQIINLLVVWTLTGLWHGTGWNYIFWGLYFFLLLVAEKQLFSRIERLPAAVQTLITLFFVYFGWVLFAHESLPELGNTLALMFGKGDFWSASVGVLFKNSVPLIALCAIGSSAIPRYISSIWSNLLLRRKKDDQISLSQCVHAVSLALFAAALLYLCTASLLGASSQPSLYASF